MPLSRLLFCALLLALPALPAAAAPLKVAVFDMELYDTSLEGEMRGKDPAETARLVQITDLLRDAVAARGDMTPVDVSSLHDRLATMPALYSCSSCETELAKDLGADRSISGFVYKISTLILYITVTERDTASGRLLRKASVSIRGDTDASWRRGMETLVTRELFKPDQQQ